jgi:hypothetical protein
MKPIACTPGWRTSASPNAPSPGRMLTSPFGRPAAISASMAARTVSGVCVGGLTTRALPVASPGAANSANISSGKFQGVMIPQMPTARWKVNIRLALSREGRVSPCRRTASSPCSRNSSAASVTSAIDSASGLPCSSVCSRASWSRRLSSSSATRRQTAARSHTFTPAHARCAVWAAATAASRSAWTGNGMVPTCSPVTGLITSNVSVPAPSAKAPSMNSHIASSSRHVPRVAMSLAASGGRTSEPLPRRLPDAQRDLFHGRLA